MITAASRPLVVDMILQTRFPAGGSCYINLYKEGKLLNSRKDFPTADKAVFRMNGGGGTTELPVSQILVINQLVQDDILKFQGSGWIQLCNSGLMKLLDSGVREEELKKMEDYLTSLGFINLKEENSRTIEYQGRGSFKGVYVILYKRGVTVSIGKTTKSPLNRTKTGFGSFGLIGLKDELSDLGSHESLRKLGTVLV
jgi:hypothetical protein